MPTNIFEQLDPVSTDRDVVERKLNRPGPGDGGSDGLDGGRRRERGEARRDRGSRHGPRRTQDGFGERDQAAGRRRARILDVDRAECL